MKTMKKIMALLLVATMLLALGTTAFAQTMAYTGTDGDGAKITITNAANGETYKVAKLFDATVTGTTDGSIAYTGTIPDDLATYFTVDSAGNISATTTLDLTDSTVQAALKTWASSNVTASATSNGSTLEFTNLPYGYYIITTTQGETAITVDSTNPNAEVIDKNTTVPVGHLGKTVSDETVSIGDTVTYTISFTTASYADDASGESSQITSYVITDTLPDFLSNVSVTSIIVDEDADDATTEDRVTVTKQFKDSESGDGDGDKVITLPWVDSSGDSLYKNGAKVTITYTATVNDNIAAGSVSTNANTVTVEPKSTSHTIPDSSSGTVTEKIYTYAFAIQKTDAASDPLAGATFQVPGLTVSGSKGNYTVVSYDPTSTTAGTTMECDDNGLLVVRGISTTDAIGDPDTVGTIAVTEVAAPDGYNKLTEPATVNLVHTSTATTTTTKYYDSEHHEVDSETLAETTELTTSVPTTGINKVINATGTELPSTGGIGTTIFYVVGGILVLAAVVVLVTRRRMAAEK